MQQLRRLPCPELPTIGLTPRSATARFVQMALGLHYMHEQRVLHRDLKTQNIFMLGNGRLVLGDLGISKVLEGEHPKPR